MLDLFAALTPLSATNGLDLRDLRVAGRGTLTPNAVMWHHTASAVGSGDMPSLGIVQNGRPWSGPNGETFLPGPLCNILIGRAGTVAVISDGRANHAGDGSWPGLTGSEQIIGVEVENDGVGEPWTLGLLAVCARVGAQLSTVFGIPAALHIGHKEWAPGRKIDPTFDMTALRTAIDALILEDDDMTDEQIDKLAKAIAREIAAIPITVRDYDNNTGVTAPLATVKGWDHDELGMIRRK